MADTGKENALFNAFRLAVTETARVQVTTGLKLMKEGGYDKYIWIAEPGACHICAPYNNQVFDMKDASMGNTLPPMHPFCRCSVAAYYDMDKNEDLGYNINIPDELKDFNLDMDIGKQKNHIYGTNEFKQRIRDNIEPSHFKNSIEEVENSLRPLIGTGTMKGTKEGNLKEIVEVNDLSSFVLNNNENKLYKTNAITLRFNKTKGWHAYPDYPSKLRRQKNENNKNK